MKRIISREMVVEPLANVRSFDPVCTSNAHHHRFSISEDAFKLVRRGGDSTSWMDSSILKLRTTVR